MAIELATTDMKAVITKDGRNVGQMSGCDMNTTTWKVDDLFITVPKDTAKEMHVKVGLFKRYVTIKIKTDTVAVVGDVIQLNIDFATLQKHLTS